MNFEKEIEKRLVESLQGALGDLAKVRGSWQTVEKGDVKDLEDATEPVYVDIRLSTAAFPTYSATLGEWTGSLAVYVPVAMDPTGEMLDAVWDVVSAWLYAMQLTLADAKRALDIEGAFTTHGFLVSGGVGVELVDGERVVPAAFLIRGKFQMAK